MGRVGWERNSTQSINAAAAAAAAALDHAGLTMYDPGWVL